MQRFILPTLLVALLPAPALAQACGTFFVDSNSVVSGSFRHAIEDVNANGCTSGGLNRIIVDNTPVASGGFGDTVIASPLPQINRPTEIVMFSSSHPRHRIRSNNASQTAANFALRSSARLVVNDLVIEGGGGRAFFGGILLVAGANDSEILGVRVENVRHQGIRISGVNGVEIRRSNTHPTEVVNSGWGLNADNPAHEAAIQATGSFNVRIFGTFLGIEQDGTVNGNCSYGIELIDTSIAQIGGTNVTSVNLRNHIGGNRFGGIRVRGGSLVSILGNYVGLAANGQTVVGNGALASCFAAAPPPLPRGGIVVEDSSSVAIGSATVNSGSVIVGNNRGVVIDNSHNINILRTLIGQRPTGQSAVNAVEAVRVDGSSGLNGTVLIGSTDPERGNVIRGSNNSLWGVIVGAGVGRVDIRKNAIYGHATGAINRPGAPNPPVLSLADSDTGLVSGSLTAVPAAGEIDVYADDGNQGRWYLGTLAVASGANSFSGSLPGPQFIEGRQITASFTHLGSPSPGTSRLSAPIAALGGDVIFRHDFE